MVKKKKNFEILKKKFILNNFDKKSLNNLKKLFFFLNQLKKKKSKILLVGDNNTYKIINTIFKTNEEKNIYFYKNIIFYKNKWIPGSITSKKIFFRKLKRKNIKLIVILKYDLFMISQLNEIIKLKLPLVFFENKNCLQYYSNKILYNIIYNNLINNSELILLTFLLKFIFYEKF